MPNAQVKTFTFKAVKPIFDIAPFKVCARKEGDTTVKLWAVTPEGHIAMDASATLA
jgi:3-methylfumaryl-CoA hydratase